MWHSFMPGVRGFWECIRASQPITCRFYKSNSFFDINSWPQFYTLSLQTVGLRTLSHSQYITHGSSQTSYLSVVMDQSYRLCCELSVRQSARLSFPAWPCFCYHHRNLSETLVTRSSDSSPSSSVFFYYYYSGTHISWASLRHLYSMNLLIQKTRKRLYLVYICEMCHIVLDSVSRGYRG